MKTLFIPLKLKSALNKDNLLKIFNQLPKKIAIAYSIQYQKIANEVASTLKKNHKITALQQVLGCSNPNFSKETQAILLISDGKFHAVSLAFETKLPVFLFNNFSFTKISEKEIEELEKKQKSAYLRYLHADKIGVLVSLKEGQSKLSSALAFKNKSKKKTYLFICNNINPSEFENFSDIQSWVNTACPRLTYDSSAIINIDKIE